MLGVESNATEIQIKKAYFNLAKKYHPDLNVHKDEEEQEKFKAKFQEVGEAYEVLADKKLKLEYDKH